MAKSSGNSRPRGISRREFIKLAAMAGLLVCNAENGVKVRRMSCQIKRKSPKELVVACIA